MLLAGRTFSRQAHAHCVHACVRSDLLAPSNALAALANLAPHCTHLHARAAQRLMALLLALTKKLTRLGGLTGALGAPLPLAAALSGGAAGGAGGGAAAAQQVRATQLAANATQEQRPGLAWAQQPRTRREPSLAVVECAPAVQAALAVLEDFVRIVLETINLCLTGPSNPVVAGGTSTGAVAAGFLGQGKHGGAAVPTPRNASRTGAGSVKKNTCCWPAACAGAEAVARSGQLASNVELVYALLHQQVRPLPSVPLLFPSAQGLECSLEHGLTRCDGTHTGHGCRAAAAPAAG